MHIIMVIGKCTAFSGDFFWVLGVAEGKELCGRIFPWRNVSWGNRNSLKRGGVVWEDIFMEEPLMGEENFNEGGVRFSSII